MSKLQEIQLDDGSVVYVEVSESLNLPGTIGNGAAPEGGQRVGKGGLMPNPTVQVTKSFRAIEDTIKTYTKHTLNAFQDAAFSDVKKVTLEFGVNVSGMGGLPYIAAGTAGCNIKVSVECVFPERQAIAQPQTQRQVQAQASAQAQHLQTQPQAQLQAQPNGIATHS
jgi:hypothetical protein